MLSASRIRYPTRLGGVSFRTKSDLTFDKYPFLKELGLKEMNEGVFDGKWSFGQGEVAHSVSLTLTHRSSLLSMLPRGNLSQKLHLYELF